MENDEEQQKHIIKRYQCPVCKVTHTVKLQSDLAKDRKRYPFPYVFLHSSEENLEDLLTVLYIDADFQIRGVEIMEIENSNIFSENLAKQIMDKLMDKIVTLEQENIQLKEIVRDINIEGVKEREISVSEEKSETIQEEDLEPIPQEDYIGEEEFEGIPNEDFIDEKSVSEQTEEDEIVEEEIEKENIEEEGDEQEEESEDDDEIIYYEEEEEAEIETKTPQSEKISLIFRSAIGPGEKKQQLTINLDNLIGDIKETVGKLYGLIPSNFHLSCAGITMDDMQKIGNYQIEEGDEVLLIPSSTAGKD